MLGVGWGRRTTHLAFGEVAGAEGSFYPLAVSREHLEKTESRESECMPVFIAALFSLSFLIILQVKYCYCHCE